MQAGQQTQVTQLKSKENRGGRGGGKRSRGTGGQGPGAGAVAGTCGSGYEKPPRYVARFERKGHARVTDKHNCLVTRAAPSHRPPAEGGP